MKEILNDLINKANKKAELEHEVLTDQKGTLGNSEFNTITARHDAE